jgi:ferritin-like metal-binding protein YciE
MSKVKTLEDLYMGQLQDLYSAEDQLIRALPKVAEKATDKKLKETILAHLEETKGQRDRIVKILESHGEKGGEDVCKAMQGLIKETDEHLKDEMTPEVTDALIIACAQRVEHYEIAAYGTAATYAQMLDLPEDAEQLGMTLEEEKGADMKLNDIAMAGVNQKANTSKKPEAKSASNGKSAKTSTNGKPSGSTAKKTPVGAKK